MYATLGNVFFTVVKGGIVGQKIKRSASYADHDVFVGKPQTQAIGIDLDEFELELQLHFTNGSVQRRIDKLNALFEAQEPVPYVKGNFRFEGVYTIRELEITSTIDDDRGGRLGAELSITLKEYAGEMPDSSPLAGIVGSILGALGVSEEIIKKVNDIVEMVETGIRIVNQVLGFIEDIKEVIDSLKTSSNPIFDLLALGGVLGQGIDLCTQITGFEFPKGGIFESFTSNVDKTSGCFGDIFNLSKQAEVAGDITPYLSPLEALSDNINTLSSRLAVDMGYMKAEIAGRSI